VAVAKLLWCLPLALVLMRAGQAKAALVVVVKNSSEAKYADPARVVANSLRGKHRIASFDLDGRDMSAAKRLAQHIVGMHPNVFVALGDKAAYLGDRFVKGVPLVFGMVANWQALHLRRSNSTGVRQNLAPETMCSQIKMFMPKLRRIGVVYTRVSKHYVERAMRRAAALSMTLLPVFINEPSEFKLAYKSLAEQVDIFWLVQDPTMVTKENLKLLIAASAEDKMPTVTYSSGLVKAGLLMSIAPDTTAVGHQLGRLAQAITQGTAPAKLPMKPPDKAKVTFNQRTLKELGLKIDPQLLDFVDLVSLKGLKGRGK